MRSLPLVSCVVVLASPSFAGDELLVSAYTSDSVTRFDASSGTLVAQLAPGALNGVLGAAIGPDGALYVCSELTDSVKRFDPASGAYLGEFIFDDPGTSFDETGGLDTPSGIVFAPNEHAYVAAFDLDALFEYDARTGAFLQRVVDPGQGGLNGPDAGLTLGPGGLIYVPSYFGNRVLRFALDGTTIGPFITNASAGLLRPRTVLFHGSSVFVASEANDRVVECDAASGAFLRNIVWNDPATTFDESGGLDAPTGIAFGPDGRLYVASGNTNSVLRYEASSGAFVDAFVPSGSGGMQFPTFLVFRPDATSYGAPTPNSVGPGATLVASGFASLAAQSLAFDLHFAVPGKTAIFFTGAASASVPFGDGLLLVDRSSARRLGNVTTDSSGHAHHDFDFAAAAGSSLPPVAGTSHFVQAYFRDPGASSPLHCNLSTGLEVGWRP